MHAVCHTLVYPLLRGALALCLPWAAWAGCSRPIQVPVSPSGLSMTVQGGTIGGIWPDFLRSLEVRSGCRFVFSDVTKVRLEQMLKDGMADLALGTIRTPGRDQHGLFIPLVQARAAVISVDARHADIQTIQDLLERKDLRVVLLRGNDYGPDYQRLVAALEKEGRVSFELDAVSVARVLKALPARLTIMAPTIFVGSVLGNPRLQDLLGPLRVEPLEELPWSFGGIYISKHALPPADQAHLRKVLTQAAQSGEIWKEYQKAYPDAVLKVGVRPVAASR